MCLHLKCTCFDYRNVQQLNKLAVPDAKDIVWFIALAVGCFVACNVLGKAATLLRGRLLSGSREDNVSVPLWKRLIPVFSFLTLAYGITLWGVYPGFFVYDACTELMQFIKGTNTTWHPLFHTFVMGKIITWVYGFNENYNQGIFAYLLIQMLVISMGYTYIYSELIRYKIPKAIRIICVGLLALFPPIVMYVLCSVTDSLFSFFLIMYTVQLIALYCTPEVFKKQPYRYVLLMLFTLMILLFRKNGIYDIVVFMPFLIFMSKKEFRLKLVATSVIAIVLFAIINNALITGMNAQKTGQQEAFAVPIQQIARVYKYYPNSFEEEDIKYLASLQDMSRWTMYDDKIADAVKEYVDGKAIMQDPSAFLSLYLKLFTKHPVTYVNAWLLTSYEMWYPAAIFDCYSGSEYEEVCYFGYITENPGWRNLAENYIDKVYRAISVRMWPHKLPIIRFIWTPGSWLWLSIAALMYIRKNGNKNFGKAFVFVYIVYLTMLLGPASLVRYVAYIFVIAPIILCGIFLPDTQTE